MSSPIWRTRSSSSVEFSPRLAFPADFLAEFFSLRVQRLQCGFGFTPFGIDAQ